MANKIELFRQINATRPDIVERLITLWGNQEFDLYVGGLFRVATQTGVSLAVDLQAALHSLLDEHRNEFPLFTKFEVAAESVQPNTLDSNPHFQVINNRFPHIGRRIRMTWGGQGFGEYLSDLFKDNRSGERQGFPPEVLLALFRIQCDHEQEYPQFSSIIRDIWSVGGQG